MNDSDTATEQAVSTPSEPARIPLNTLAIAFGLAGLAGTWSAAVDQLGMPGILGECFWVVAAIAWVWLIVAHLRRGARSAESLGSQLRNPAQGAVAALVPAVGMLLGNHLFGFWKVGGGILIVVCLVASLAFAGWHLSHWANGRTGVDAIHGGYFLPTVASGYVAAISFADLGLTGPAIGAFGIASLFWVVIFTVLMFRLASRPPLPAPLVPTMMIMLAPPALGGEAWFAIEGLHSDPVADFLAATLVLLAAMQIALLPTYRRLPFSLGFWSFTFPLAAAATSTIDWMSIAHPAGWQGVDVAVLAAVTVIIAAIAARSLSGRSATV